MAYTSHAHAAARYYVPAPSAWPFITTMGLVTFMVGFGNWLNGYDLWRFALFAGLVWVCIMAFIWFRGVSHESEGGAYNPQVDRTFRWAMSWFIFSEVMFFGAFFGALFYARQLAVPWLAGEGAKLATNEFIWKGFEAVWPTNGPADIGGTFEIIPAWGVPFLNTILLVSSGGTITVAHHYLKENKRKLCILWMFATIALGSGFLYFQASEYIHAYHELNLTLGSGVYGSTFFMLTGFHGAHVTLGTIMLSVITLRLILGHFKPDSHFGFEGVAWYWHFVDVVWIGLFIFVYIL